MAKGQGNPDLSPKTYVGTGIMLCIIAAVAVTAAYLYWNADRNLEPTLEPPERSVATSTEDLISMLAKAFQEGPIKSNVHRLKVPIEEHPNFRLHLENAGARRGWYTHSPTWTGMSIVLPEEELRYLEELQDDPMGWVRREAVKRGPAVGPSSLNLTNATVRIRKTDLRLKENLALLGGISLCVFLSVTGITMLVMGYQDHLKEKREIRRRHSKGQEQRG